MTNLPLVLTFVGLVVTIFGASWINQRSQERQMDLWGKRLEDRIDQLEKRLDQRMGSLEQRVERIERQLEAVFKPVLPPR